MKTWRGVAPSSYYSYYRLAGVSARGKVETFCIIWLPLAANFTASRSPCLSRLIKYAKLFGILNNFRDGATFSIKAPKRAQSKQGARPSRTAVPNGIAVERVIKLAAKRITAAEREWRNERERKREKGEYDRQRVWERVPAEREGTSRAIIILKSENNLAAQARKG